ncbi:MAG TPA: septal ring lytic transglycosylase RlpA family protein [Firmicutes bacterium]|jgi:rare lipoprotein A (peptidoglycan hydrolase)|nr:septal ring lytic transglycosylase RlpA family protein [Bacillota bacterium]
MIGPGFFRSMTGQASLYLLAIAAASGAFFGLQSLRNLKIEERAAIESCDSFLERSEIALGRAKHRQKILLCPPPPPPPTPAAKRVARAEPSPSREGRQSGAVSVGMASFYGGSDGLTGSPTASGELFDPCSFTAAHRTLPFGTRVRVTFLKTGKSTVVRINDRGPFSGSRIIDISRAAAREIGLQSYGVGKVSVEVLP